MQIISGWLFSLCVLACLIAADSFLLSRHRHLDAAADAAAAIALARLIISVGAFLLMLACARTGRYEYLFEEGTVFSGVGYTDAHVTLAERC